MGDWASPKTLSTPTRNLENRETTREEEKIRGGCKFNNPATRKQGDKREPLAPEQQEGGPFSGSKTLGLKCQEAPVETTREKPRQICGLV